MVCRTFKLALPLAAGLKARIALPRHSNNQHAHHAGISFWRVTIQRANVHLAADIRKGRSEVKELDDRQTLEYLRIPTGSVLIVCVVPAKSDILRTCPPAVPPRPGQGGAESGAGGGSSGGGGSGTSSGGRQRLFARCIGRQEIRRHSAGWLGALLTSRRVSRWPLLLAAMVVVGFHPYSEAFPPEGFRFCCYCFPMIHTHSQYL